MKHVHLAGNGKPQKKQRREESVRRLARALPRKADMVIAQGKLIRAPKVKKRAIAETELDKFPDGLSGEEERKQLA